MLDYGQQLRGVIGRENAPDGRPSWCPHDLLQANGEVVRRLSDEVGEAGRAGEGSQARHSASVAPRMAQALAPRIHTRAASKPQAAGAHGSSTGAAAYIIAW